MTTLRKNILIGLTVLGLGASSFAVQAQQRMHGMWGEHAAQHQQQLRALLKLTPAQDSAWAAYVATMTPPARAVPGNWKTMPAPQRMEQRVVMARERLARMESQLSALTAFYNTLTPEQKKTFDANSMGPHDGHRMGHHMGG